MDTVEYVLAKQKEAQEAQNQKAAAIYLKEEADWTGGRSAWVVQFLADRFDELIGKDWHNYIIRTEG